MNTKPILFSTPMVKAILKGRKTQTRRAVKCRGNWYYDRYEEEPWPKVMTEDDYQPIRAPYQIGDILYVKETYQHTQVLNLHPSDENYGYVYRADDDPWVQVEQDLKGWRWKPSLFMPKTAARLFLEVTNVRAEWLQDISEADCYAEGVPADCPNPIEAFKAIWDKINKGGWSFESTAVCVWVIEFKIFKIVQPEK